MCRGTCPVTPSRSRGLRRRPRVPARSCRGVCSCAAGPPMIRPTRGSHRRGRSAPWCHPGGRHHHQQGDSVLLESDFEVDAVDPYVHIVGACQRAFRERCRLGLPLFGEPVDRGGGQAVPVPRNCSNADAKSLVDSLCRYSSGSTSDTFGDLRDQAGRIDEANRFRSPVTGSTRLSSTCGWRTCTAPAAVTTSRELWWPLRSTSRRPRSSISCHPAGQHRGRSGPPSRATGHPRPPRPQA
jgi:hypothetical protein